MAGYNGNNGQSNKVYINQRYKMNFHGSKAYELTIVNDKVKLEIISSTNENGRVTWNRDNKTSVLMSMDDAVRLHIACRQLISIYLATKADPSIITKNPIYTTDRITIPLVARMNGNIFGSITVGILPDGNDGSKTFGIKYQLDGRDNAPATTDWITFKRTEGASGSIVYGNADQADFKTASLEHLGFTNFVMTLGAILTTGRSTHALQNELEFKIKGSGSRGGYNNGGGNSGGGQSSGGQSYGDDIPF